MLLSIVWFGGITNLECATAFAIAIFRAIAHTTLALVICKLRVEPDFLPFAQIGVTQIHFWASRLPT